MIVDLDLVREHLRLAPDATDALLVQIYTAAAVQRVVRYLGRPVYPVDTPPDPMPMDAIPASEDIQLAVMILTGLIYDNRDGQADSIDHGMPATVHELLAPHRRWVAVI